MSCRASKPAFLCTVRSVGVFGVLEIKPYFVEALFGDKVFAFGAEVAAIDNGVDQGVGVGAQVSAGFDTSDAFEA